MVIEGREEQVICERDGVGSVQGLLCAHYNLRSHSYSRTSRVRFDMTLARIVQVAGSSDKVLFFICPFVIFWWTGSLLPFY